MSQQRLCLRQTALGVCGLLWVWHWEGGPNPSDMGSALWMQRQELRWPTCLLTAARLRLYDIPEPSNV